mmetsp:Transcript_13825/g.30088  ORF Transcript_13825/g.30088 Transcript_13825/m.30088 type:complete len:688 (-) Transcript_13825:139-2202(-)|eukprot:CAMPEP_0172313442 /NCGR_PEP_ID=MMETSP1058-20130122/20185_1 /TAXON_ID=83371 /ORGANISM="Detonula confervacea, Strain CCMP 353" /LENGTH=687 /DNA_ID=CAMNT_0013027089 /DNA_START=98 /DNA_END=2161 /DNA_ORIENTATION=-
MSAATTRPPLTSEQTAGRARQKAEARRQRILARGAERLDVVNGFVPSSSIASTPTANDAASTAPVVAPTADATPTVESAAIAEDGNDAPSGSKGARRMAAMRRRRYKSKPKEEPEGSTIAAPADDDAKEEEKTDIKKEEAVDANNAAAEIKVAVDNSVAKKESDEVAELVPSASTAKKEEKEIAAPASESTEFAAVTNIEKDDKENNAPTPTKTNTTSTPVEVKKEEEPKKKYMGVARMRRRALKEQKAQRLKDIADAEVMGTPNRSHSGADLERELAAEMAAMDVTASMVRKGGLDLGERKGSLGGIALKKGLRKKWYSMFVPPMKLVPRMVTLLLLFFAGLDLGTQPHTSPASSSLFGGDLAARDLSSVVAATAGNLIQHVEPSLTKPWEYGMGGKVAFAVGMAPSSPPTAMPTSFNEAIECIAKDDGEEECVATNNKQSNEKSSTKKGKKKKSKITLQLTEDEFDSSRTRPKGVVSHDDEFNDDDAGTLNKAPNIDPLFKIDLDAILVNANLPMPLDYAAKFAIGFHRTWVYYLWTLPTTFVKSLFSMPKNFLSGWIANPPWILGVVLLIRLAIKILVGDGKSFSLNSSSGKDDSGGGKGGGNLDMLGQGMDMAKNYVTSKFPKITIFFTTLMKVMKVDMYVVLCGFLIGLVMPSVREDYLAWFSGIGGEESGTGRTVLGDGEL